MEMRELAARAFARRKEAHGLEPIIKLRNLVKVYHVGDEKLRALDGVNLDVYPGEFLCIVGRSGSGKSTLLNMLAGLEKPTRGAIQIAGERLDKMNESQLVRFRLQHVGFIFQQFNLFPSLTALENVTMPLVYRGVAPKVRKKKALAILKQLGLSTHVKHKPSQMSGGQQQRVGIARALVASPEIVFADEPTGNLDSRTSDEILGLIKEIARKNGATLIMVTHDNSIAERADRVVRLLDGKIIEIIDNRQNAQEQPQAPQNNQSPKEELPA